MISNPFQQWSTSLRLSHPNEETEKYTLKNKTMKDLKTTTQGTTSLDRDQIIKSSKGTMTTKERARKDSATIHNRDSLSLDIRLKKAGTFKLDTEKTTGMIIEEDSPSTPKHT